MICRTWIKSNLFDEHKGSATCRGDQPVFNKKQRLSWLGSFAPNCDIGDDTPADTISQLIGISPLCTILVCHKQTYIFYARFQRTSLRIHVLVSSVTRERYPSTRSTALGYSRIIKDYSMDTSWIIRCRTSIAQLPICVVKAEAAVPSHQELKRPVSERGTVGTKQASSRKYHIHALMLCFQPLDNSQNMIYWSGCITLHIAVNSWGSAPNRTYLSIRYGGYPRAVESREACRQE
jgi:hypothetical protein